MDCVKTGILIRNLRVEKGYTQKMLAEKLNISDKTVSKWERGLGYPDISLVCELAEILEVNTDNILEGEINSNDFIGGNMKNSKFYVCPVCGNIACCTGSAEITCCGRRLEALTAEKADENNKLNVCEVENDWFITSEHPMNKKEYISFAAFLTGDKVQIIKQYPEWNFQIRIPRRGHGKLVWYSTNEGLLYQLL